MKILTYIVDMFIENGINPDYKVEGNIVSITYTHWRKKVLGKEKVFTYSRDLLITDCVNNSSVIKDIIKKDILAIKEVLRDEKLKELLRN